MTELEALRRVAEAARNVARVPVTGPLIEALRHHLDDLDALPAPAEPDGEVVEEREAVARGCDDAAEAEEHLAALAEKDGDRRGAQIHRVAAQENRQTATAIRSRGEPR